MDNKEALHAIAEAMRQGAQKWKWAKGSFIDRYQGHVYLCASMMAACQFEGRLPHPYLKEKRGWVTEVIQKHTGLNIDEGKFDHEGNMTVGPIRSLLDIITMANDDGIPPNVIASKLDSMAEETTE